MGWPTADSQNDSSRSWSAAGASITILYTRLKCATTSTYAGIACARASDAARRLDADELANLESASAPDKGVRRQYVLRRRHVGRLNDRESADLDLRSRLPLGEAGHRVDGSPGVSPSLAGLRQPRAE